MSLETNIQELNANIVALIGALRSIGNGHAEPAVVEKVEPLAAERPSKIAERIADEAPVKQVAALVTFEDVKRSVLKLAAKDRKAAVDLLARHGAKKVTDLAESAYAGVEFEAKALLGE